MEKSDHITKEMNHILEEKFDEFNDDYQNHLILDKDAKDMEDKIMTMNQKN